MRAAYCLFLACTLGSGTALASVIAGPLVNPANGHSYYLLDANTWTASELEAFTLGGHLATVNDAAEQSFIYSTFLSYTTPSTHLWIGLSDRDQEGTFVWVSSEPVSYTNWGAGEPNDGGSGEDFVEMRTDIGGVWNDNPDSPGPTNLRLGVVEVPLFDGVDYPIGWPDGTGWNHGSCVEPAADCSTNNCTAGDGLDYLEPHDYGGGTGCVLHPGEDWNLPPVPDGNVDCGETVHAIGAGTVLARPQDCSWGALMIRHDGVPGYGSLWSVYGHMDTTTLAVGDQVSRGQVVGTVSDKDASSCHLHFEIRRVDRPACEFPSQAGGGQDPAAAAAIYLDASSFIEANRELDSRSVRLDSNDSDWLVGPDSASLSITGDITVEAWVKVATDPSDECYRILSKHESDGADRHSYNLGYCEESGTKRLLWQVSQNGVNNDNYYDINPGLTTNEWHHVAVAWDADGSPANSGWAQFVVDGWPTIGTGGTLGVTSIQDNTSRFAIGAQPTDDSSQPTDFFDGWIDDVRVWNRLRTPAEIGEDAGRELTGRENGLVGLWRFNNPGTPFVDSSPSGNDLTATGTPTLLGDVPSFACSDGVDADVDGYTDYPADIGCGTAVGVEAPQCQDGADNDSDGFRDFDGGVSVLGQLSPSITAPDPNCVGPGDRKEAASCGLGPELAWVVGLIWIGRRERRRRRSR